MNKMKIIILFFALAASAYSQNWIEVNSSDSLFKMFYDSESVIMHPDYAEVQTLTKSIFFGDENSVMLVFIYKNKNYMYVSGYDENKSTGKKNIVPGSSELKPIESASNIDALYKILFR